MQLTVRNWKVLGDWPGAILFTAAPTCLSVHHFQVGAYCGVRANLTSDTVPTAEVGWHTPCQSMPQIPLVCDRPLRLQKLLKFAVEYFSVCLSISARKVLYTVAL